MREDSFLQSILRAAPIGIGVVKDRIFFEVNPYLCAMTGYSAEELLGKSAKILYPTEEDLNYVGREKYAQITAYGTGTVETRWKRKDGSIMDVLLSSTPIDRSDNSKGVTFTALDITHNKRNQKILQARLNLLEYAQTHGIAEILVKTLDEIEHLTESKVAFYHFLDRDQKTIGLQAWSSNTTALYCTAEGRRLHYDIEKAGVWVDCVRQRRPVIHNDYASLPHRKGFPEGHVPIVREITVPVIRQGLITAILGVGNKDCDYDENDCLLVAQFADVAWDIAERRMMQDTITRNEQQLRQIASNIPAAVFRFSARQDGAYEMLYMSDGAERIFERPLSEMTSRPFSFRYLHPEDEGDFKQSVEQAVAQVIPWTREFRIITPTGTVKWLRASSNPHRTDDGGLLWDGVILDITELKEAEEEQMRLRERLLQSHKMESIGRLAGGVAHDFNNMLGVILGNTELLLSGCGEEDPQRESLQTIQKAAQRSADLVRQLLAFARKQIYSPKPLNLNDTIEAMLRMLSRMIGEHIQLEWQPGFGVPMVMMDPVQLDQILANLCANARDAIKDTGTITIKTQDLRLKDPDGVKHPDVAPGHYALLSFKDDGCGMTGETLEKIFEPFFTTKDVGKGTGLGLPTVYGIVKQNKGFINVTSFPGKGTDFRIYIPALEEQAPNTSIEPHLRTPKGGSETILLVEDEPMMLEMGKMMLQKLGYKVITAGGPSEALRAAREQGADLDLLITDVVMPEMNGKQLAEEIQRIVPGIRCLFASGYPQETASVKEIPSNGFDLIEKPFTLRTLSDRIRETLRK
jgi:PAS domain S-box-containing protein